MQMLVKLYQNMQALPSISVKNRQIIVDFKKWQKFSSLNFVDHKMSVFQEQGKHFKMKPFFHRSLDSLFAKHDFLHSLYQISKGFQKWQTKKMLINVFNSKIKGDILTSNILKLSVYSLSKFQISDLYSSAQRSVKFRMNL